MWLSPFFALAAVSPTRQRTFRFLAGAHVASLALAVTAMHFSGIVRPPILLGNFLLVAAIVEGALLVGWRLTQLPKSQALEFLLVSPLRPPLVFLAEALVGISRLALVTLAGLPVLIFLIANGFLFPGDLPALLLVPFLWGAVAGLTLTFWAFEPAGVRRWGERLLAGSVVFYLVVGVLAGENLPRWLGILPSFAAGWFLDIFRGLHEHNPFGVMKYAMENPPHWAWLRVAWISVVGALLALAFLTRAALRLHGHFQDEHYRPVILDEKKKRQDVGDQPLTWWAVKRVTKFSGRINLWLAGGFALMYAAFTIFEASWPAWLGRQVFTVFDRMGGIPVLATALVLLAAVPAAFQYGVWDSNASDRCRRLELLLLTRLDGPAYWHASACAAWNRGRGYFAVALLLWTAALIADKATLAQVLASLSGGVILWALYFALGFRAFSRGMQANLLGLALTLGLPLATILLAQRGWHFLAGLLPPGTVYFPTAAAQSWAWMLGPLLAGLAALIIARRSLLHCDAQLRRWYDLHHGVRTGE